MKGTIAVTLELQVVDGLLTGTARSGDDIRDFAGWLGLLGALDALVPPVPASPPRCREDAAVNASGPRREP
jgi:hypothetical protein